VSNFSAKEQWDWVDVRIEIGRFERANRTFPPRPRTTSTSWYYTRWPHLDIFACIRFTSDEIEQSRTEYEAEQFYRYHSPVFKGWLLNFGDQGTNL